MSGRWAKLGVQFFSLICIIVLAACTSSTGSVSASKAVPKSETEARPQLVRPTMWPQPEGDLPPAVPPEELTLIVVPSFIETPPAFYEVLPLGPGVQGPIRTMDVPKPKGPRPDASEGEEPAPPEPLQPEAGPTVKATEPAPLAPPAMTTTFGSTNFDDNGTNTGFSFIPADPIGASGPNHVVDVVNVTLRFHTKAGVQTFNSSLKNFFAPLAPPTFTFDPKVIFDQYAGRFVVITLEQEDDGAGGSPETSRILVAVSDDADPAGTWYQFDINSKTLIAGNDTWADYPGFAIDEEAIYINCNMFEFDATGGSFGGIRLWVIDKGFGSSGFYDGGTASVSVYDPYAGGGIDTATTQPAHIFGGGPSGVGTFLVSYSGLSDGSDEYVQIVRIDSPLTSLAFSQQYVNIGNIEGSSGFPDAPQLGTSTDVETNDRRALHAVWADDSLWMVATIVPKTGDADAGETTAYWWELDTTTLATITVADQGAILGDDIATDTFTYYPSIAVNGKGQVVIGFSASAATIYPGSFYTTRVPADAAGTTSGSGTMTAGTDYYVRTFGTPENRWGDYSGASIDPTNGCMWVFNKHAMTRGSGTAPEDGRWATSHGTFCISGACPTDMFLAGITFTGTETRKAASRITTGKNVTLNSGSDVTLRANDLIIFHNGLSVNSGAKLTAELSATPCQ
jgi:hypothetical protein